MAKQWDVFCRVIDNFGDIGVCWRLAADLAQRGESVRLWVDDASALAWMAPTGAPRVHVLPWADALHATPGEVVIEAFGCELPGAFVARMAEAQHPPVWVNLEYLSAEAYVERCHRLPSPQLSGPGRGLQKWFFYPGFTSATGGLLREPGLAGMCSAFQAQPTQRQHWLQARGIAAAPETRWVSVFAYASEGLPAWLPRALSPAPTLLLLTPGTAEPLALPPWVRCARLPYLSQPEFDQLLWACDLNLVRGEDSFVRAQWAGRPFVWQIYPQSDGAHADKLDAFLARHLGDAPPVLAQAVHSLWRRWNGLPAGDEPKATAATPPDAQAWLTHTVAWRRGLHAQPDLVTQLLSFVAETQ
jgi:uncharacterized repeat protein (TIGR03837 family)